MKKLLLTILIVLFLTTAANAWTINGVEASTFKLHPVKAISGALVSAAVHCAGHHLMAAAFNKSMDQDGFYEVWHGTYTRSEEAWIGRAGFLAQLGTGFILNKLDIDESFRAGFNGMSLVEITSYPFIHKNEKRDDNHITGAGDLGNIAASGNVRNELMLYIGTAIYNLNGSFK